MNKQYINKLYINKLYIDKVCTDGRGQWITSQSQEWEKAANAASPPERRRAGPCPDAGVGAGVEEVLDEYDALQQAAE